MKRYVSLLTVLFWIFTIALSPVMAQEPEKGPDKTLSPYFLVKSDDPSVDQMPLLSTTAKVDIAGVIADVVVTQVYKNAGKKPIEAIYVFPASSRAAVYGMKMTIGQRTIEAKIEKKQEAREQYEKAKEEGKSASLLEQQRPNVFQMNVANIMPGDEIKVELKYTELLVPTDAVYEFAYPTVVGPRYSNQPEATAPASEKWVQNPYLHEGEKAPYTFDIVVSLAAGLPIQDVTCNSHKVSVSYDGKANATIKLDPSEKDGGNRDYILKYRLAGGQIQSGLLLYQGGKENFFLLMVQPPQRVAPNQIPPREYIFIVDVSGSMHGFPLDISKKLLKDLIGNLKPTDMFNVLLFSGGSAAMSEKSLPATQENVAKAVTVIEQQQGGGGTELLPALKKALALPRAAGVSRTVVIATDGYVSVEKEAFDLIRENLGQANMFAFGIGSSVNRFIIDGMARVGMGEPFVITKPDEAPAIADKFRKMIQTPVLTQVKAEFGEFKTSEVEPVSIPDVLAERPVVIFGKWSGDAKGTIKLSGLTGDKPYEQKIAVADVKSAAGNSALKYLWARHRIAILDDYNNLAKDDKRVQEVTDLGLKYNLLTAYTSFVAIDTEVRNKEGKPTTVKQPLPLPEGVSDLAVGGKAKMAMRAGGAMPAPMAPPTEARMPEKEARPRAEEPKNIPESKPAQDELKKQEKQGKVTLEKFTVKGGLTRDQVQKAFEQNKGTIEECYSNALSAAAGLKGKITMQVEIDYQGKVTKTTIMKNELQNPDLEKCIIEKIGAWLFPAAAPGKNTTLTLVLVMNP